VPNIKIGEAPISGKDMSWQVVLIVGFLAGFIERLVPGLLDRTAEGQAGQPNPPPAAPAPVPAPAPARAPAPAAAPAPPEPSRNPVQHQIEVKPGAEWDEATRNLVYNFILTCDTGVPGVPALKTNLRMAKRLAIMRDTDNLIAVGAVKIPQPSYRRRVTKNSGIDVVACVKFSNLTMVLGDMGGGLLCQSRP
jgi:hypothetical protein